MRSKSSNRCSKSVYSNSLVKLGFLKFEILHSSTAHRQVNCPPKRSNSLPYFKRAVSNSSTKSQGSKPSKLLISTDYSFELRGNIHFEIAWQVRYVWHSAPFAISVSTLGQIEDRNSNGSFLSSSSCNRACSRTSHPHSFEISMATVTQPSSPARTCVVAVSEIFEAHTFSRLVGRHSLPVVTRVGKCPETGNYERRINSLSDQ
ncbi:hypothetical protein NPIL_610841 [Nephila pilipes]|uniref:Uncharacterized protein n=1 Tax=Nephila pilipes TaxID=299642 RepID=A0A8X6KJ62_NEPPI|nr:hypothetical protein NPIL_610841 [Nephila pilipes]